MGSKGQSTTNTQQSQSYNPAGAGYIQNALQQGQAAAQTPFQQPVAPVAGFSQDQRSAFNTVNNAQGMAQPYINQAAQDFTPQGTQNFLNPYASNVMAGLQNVFGQQQSQATGQLTQAAGGVGADRIAVGQSELANQQGLAAGQTLSSLYGQAAQQAQSAGYGTAALGSQAQNAALSGAQAQLGTGGLQQQLQQAQMNAPYQQQLAALAYPFQTAQFNAGITGALAPGLGGTTSGYGTSNSTPAPPSIYSQILGLGAAGAGIAGGAGAFGGKGSGGTPGSQIGGFTAGPTSYGGQSGPTPLSGTGSFGGAFNSARGGAIPGYDDGGNVIPIGSDPAARALAAIRQAARAIPGNDNEAPPFSGRGPAGANDNEKKFDDGGSTGLPTSGPYQVPQGLSDKPIDVAPKSVVPAEQLTPIKANIPQLNLNPPQQPPQGNSGGDISSMIGTAAKIGLMFAKRGGAIPGFAEGGDTMEDRFKPVKDAIASGDFDPAGANSTMFEGQPGMTASNTGVVPMPRSRPIGAAAAADDADTAVYPPPAATASPRDAYAQAPPEDDHTPTNTPVPPPKDPGFAGSPWAALMQAGLSIAGGTSPYAGVNIGKGAQEGLKTLESQRAAAQKDETVNQAAKRLQMEADHHVDAMTKVTKQQSIQNERQKDRDDLAERQFNRPYEELTKAEQARLEESRREHELARVPPGYRKTDDGNLEPITGGPHDPKNIEKEAAAKRPPGMNDEALRPLVDSYKAGNTGVLNGIGRGTQGAQNLERFWTILAEDLKNEGKTGKDLAAAKANFMAQSAGARVSAQRESNIETAVNEAKGTFPQVLATSEALPRTNYPAINTVIEAYRTGTGSPEQRKFGAAIQAAVTAYSQAMSRTGANSVYAQQHAQEIISKADGHEALKGAIDQLNTEMAIAKAAPEETRQAILNRILGIEEPKTATPPATGATAAPATANAAPQVGERKQFKQGWGKWDGTKWVPD